MERILKKNWLLALAAVMISCLSFTACGSDHKDEPDDPTTSDYAKLLVGEWERDRSLGGGLKYTFYANGKGSCEYYSDSTGDWKNDGNFSWKVKGFDVSLDYGDGYIEYYSIINLDETDLIWQSPDDHYPGEYYTEYFKRVK